MQLLLFQGLLLAVWLSSREAVRVGLKEDDVFDVMLWGLPRELLARACITSLFNGKIM